MALSHWLLGSDECEAIRKQECMYCKSLDHDLFPECKCKNPDSPYYQTSLFLGQSCDSWEEGDSSWIDRIQQDQQTHMS